MFTLCRTVKNREGDSGRSNARANGQSRTHMAYAGVPVGSPVWPMKRCERAGQVQQDQEIGDWAPNLEQL